MTPATAMSSARAACPKHMTHGPCGGVQPGGDCEVGGPCSFVTDGGDALMPLAPVAPRGAIGARSSLNAAAGELLDRLSQGRFVVADLPSPGPLVDAERALAATVAGSVDAVLLGDAPWARLQLPPALRAGLVASEGVRPWPGMNCRDRSRVALEAELAALDGTGMPAVHCVTGDHPALGQRADAPAVFDLDSTQLVTRAAIQTGLVISAAESPESPPVAARAARAASKAAAGADVLFINHCRSVEAVAEFAAQVRELAPGLRLIACVPLVVSQAGADRLTAFLHGPLPSELAAPLTAPDPVAAGIAVCVAHAEALLEIPQLAGVDLSAPAGPGEAMRVASALAETGRALKG
ncbi:MAG: methylenetetrahydrofolate reductase C-terminal domain-containing protein [Solirubrobacteraceae bacterium]|nr:methylenetetrahydrofolate reductase C-terminal domain-containing protein [Solirubrobacteraceae bacterium]